MHVYKRDNSNYWWACIERPHKAPLRFSTRHANKSEALKVMVAKGEELKEQAEGRLEITLADAVARAERSKRTSDDYKSFSGRCAKVHAPNGQHPVGRYRGTSALPSEMRLSGLKDHHIEDYKMARIEEGMAASSINNELKVIARALKVCRGYKLPVDLRITFLPTKHKLRYLLAGEEQRLLNELLPSRQMKYQPEQDKRAAHTRIKLIDQYDFVLLLLDTGMRHSEGSQIPWVAVDTTHWRNISIYRSKVGKEAVLPLSARLRTALQRRWLDSKQGALYNYVFPGWEGTQQAWGTHRGHATGGIQKAIDRAGLNADHLVKRYSKFTVHSFRHSFAARMVQNGMPLHELRDLLGHSTVKTTEIYAHLAPSQGSDRMAQILEATTT